MGKIIRHDVIGSIPIESKIIPACKVIRRWNYTLQSIKDVGSYAGLRKTVCKQNKSHTR